MTPIVSMMLALAAGYVVAVLAYFFLTMAITSTVPQFVSLRGRFRLPYLFTTLVLWVLCTCIGGYLTTWLSAAGLPLVPVSVLAISLAAITWLHPLEIPRRSALFTRTVMAAAPLIGVGFGYYLRVR